jgi:hypothetical protein
MIIGGAFYSGGVETSVLSPNFFTNGRDHGESLRCMVFVRSLRMCSNFAAIVVFKLMVVSGIGAGW